MTDESKYLPVAEADTCGYGHMAEKDIGKNFPVSAKEVAEKFGVSERTARRHLAKGTLPSANRRKASRYGKVFTVPAPGPSLRDTMCHGTDLLMARAALRRVDRYGDRFNRADLVMAEEIFAELAVLLHGWREAEYNARSSAANAALDSRGS